MSNQTEQEPGELHVVEASALESMERANTDVQISTAKRYPRSLANVKKQMLSFATLDEDTAAACFYTLSRQGKTIQGPSVRLAEIAVSSYQNIKASARIIGNDGKTITAQAVCHDLENNVCIGVEVKRRITDKSGKTYSEDMQVVTGNAACAIAFRNAVFKVVPGALVGPVYEQVKEVAIGNAKTLSQRRDKALDTFAKMGVSQARVLEMLNRQGIEEIDLKDIEKLLGIHTAIKEGDTTIDEQFPAATAPAAGKLAEAQERREAKEAIAAKPDPQPSPQEALKSFVEQAGFDWPTFDLWAVGTGQVPDGVKWTSWDDISTDVATRLLRSPTGLKKGLKEASVVAKGGTQ